jgi:hypothetical protein
MSQSKQNRFYETAKKIRQKQYQTLNQIRLLLATIRLQKFAINCQDVSLPFPDSAACPLYRSIQKQKLMFRKKIEKKASGQFLKKFKFRKGRRGRVSTTSVDDHTIV